MKYAEIKKYDIANGPGIRVSFFASGCRHACPGCFNAEARDFNYGNEFSEQTVKEVIQALKPQYLSGLTLLGGEPLAPENQPMIWDLVRQVRAVFGNTKSIWCFSGFRYEFIEQYMVPRLPYTDQLLEQIDVLVDGKWIQELKSLNLRFRGSSNQRVIDLATTRKTGEIVRALGEIEKKKFIQEALITPDHLHGNQQYIPWEQKIIKQNFPQTIASSLT